MSWMLQVVDVANAVTQLRCRPVYMIMDVVDDDTKQQL